MFELFYPHLTFEIFWAMKIFGPQPCRRKIFQSCLFCFIYFRTSVFVDPFTEVDEQLAKERAEELAKTREKEQNLMAKKKQVDPAGLKAYSKGVGKFINPNLKKKAQKIDDEDLATPVVKKKKQIKKSMNDFSGWRMCQMIVQKTSWSSM